MTDERLKHERPSEFLDLLSYILVFAPDRYPESDSVTNPEVFAEAFEALQHFISHTPTEEGREALRQCVRNLELAFEFFEHDSNLDARTLVQDTEEMFKRARKFIDVPSW